MKRIGKGGCFFLLAVLAACWMAVPGLALGDDQDQTRTQIKGGQHLDEPIKLQLKLRDQISKDTGLTQSQIDELEPLLVETVNLYGGDTEPVRKMVRESVEAGCVAECLQERIRVRNREMTQTRKQIQTPEGDMVREQTRERARERTETQTEEGSGEQNQEQSGSGEGGQGGGK
ncbi:hypothetical protein MUP29_13790 [bacterium]|nr:hypothetical protein [bacterium]